MANSKYGVVIVARRRQPRSPPTKTKIIHKHSVVVEKPKDTAWRLFIRIVGWTSFLMIAAAIYAHFTGINLMVYTLGAGVLIAGFGPRVVNWFKTKLRGRSGRQQTALPQPRRLVMTKLPRSSKPETSLWQQMNISFNWVLLVFGLCLFFSVEYGPMVFGVTIIAFAIWVGTWLPQLITKIRRGISDFSNRI